MAHGNPNLADATPRSPGAARLRAWEVQEHAARIARALLARIRPRLSLTTGSLLVLLTLFLPIGYEACGPPRTGYELVRGQGDWPSFLGITSAAGGRGFYIACLLLAAITLLFVLLSVSRPQVSRRPALVIGMFRLAGTVSLFLIFDLCFLLVVLTRGWQSAAASALAGVACLSSGLFWPKRLFIGWLSVIVSWISLLFVVEALATPGDAAFERFLVLFEVVWALVPVGIWFRFSLTRSPEVHAQWPEIRAGLAAFYTAAVVGNLWFLAVAVQERVWGLVPCYFGIQLMTLGYMQLAKRAESAQSTATSSGT
jgi:hypothetical protein